MANGLSRDVGLDQVWVLGLHATLRGACREWAMSGPTCFRPSFTNNSMSGTLTDDRIATTCDIAITRGTLLLVYSFHPKKKTLSFLIYPKETTTFPFYSINNLFTH